jgi:phage shock protein A
MARDGFLARLSNLWRGFLSLWISGLEKEHPEIAYENAINGMIEKYSALKKATAAIIRRREDIEARLKSSKAELAQVGQDLDAAVATNQDDLGVMLIQKKTQLSTDVAELEGEMQASVKDAESAKASLIQVQGEIRKLKAEKDNMLAKMASANARLRIQEQLEGLSVDAEVKALDNVREHIHNLVAESNLGKELQESSLDQRLAQLRQQGGETNARQELERLKAAATAKKAQTKTM